MTPHDDNQNIQHATRIAEKIFSMDYFSAQLRLIHTAPLREGQFDLEAIKTMHSHLTEIHHISGHLMSQILTLTPTITNEPATAPEKETIP